MVARWKAIGFTITTGRIPLWFGTFGSYCEVSWGESRLPEMQFLSGQPVVIGLPAPPLKTPLQLRGPGLSAAESVINLGENRGPLV